MGALAAVGFPAPDELLAVGHVDVWHDLVHGRAGRPVDILYVVDNSSGTEKQQEQLPVEVQQQPTDEDQQAAQLEFVEPTDRLQQFARYAHGQLRADGVASMKLTGVLGNRTGTQETTSLYFHP